MTLVLILIGINVIAFLAFGWDKRQAERHQSRIPERTLLGLALVGGAFGALCGQQVFRHKTKKQPFRTLLILAAVANLAVAILLATPSLLRGPFLENVLCSGPCTRPGAGAGGPNLQGPPS